MSERTEIVRLPFDAYRRGDLDVFAGWMHPDIEIHDWPERRIRAFTTASTASSSTRRVEQGVGVHVQYFTDRNAALAAAELTEEQIRQEAT